MSYLGEGEEARVSRAESWGAGGHWGWAETRRKWGAETQGEEDQDPERGGNRNQREGDRDLEEERTARHMCRNEG